MFVCLIFKGALKLVSDKGSFVHDEIFVKNLIKYDPFPVSCLKDIPWKVVTDETEHLFESNLQFPGMNLLRVLVDTFFFFN